MNIHLRKFSEIINNLNKRVKYEEPCDGRLSSTVPREGRVKVPPLTRLLYAYEQTDY